MPFDRLRRWTHVRVPSASTVSTADGRHDHLPVRAVGRRRASSTSPRRSPSRPARAAGAPARASRPRAGRPAALARRRRQLLQDRRAAGGRRPGPDRAPSGRGSSRSTARAWASSPTRTGSTSRAGRCFDEARRGRRPTPVAGLGLPRRSLVAVGGGKDSCVSLEVLRGAPATRCVAVQHRRAPGRAGLRGGRRPAAGRRAPRRSTRSCGELNRAGALNGHVPVTAIVSLVAVAQALVTGADEVVFSQRALRRTSASFGRDGLPVNHQYSKGLAAERLLRAALAGGDARSSPTTRCCGRCRSCRSRRVVRPASSAYLPVFTSCNAAFRIDEGRRVERWCGHCPKCRFVFLVLAPFLPARATSRRSSAPTCSRTRRQLAGLPRAARARPASSRSSASARSRSRRSRSRWSPPRAVGGHRARRGAARRAAGDAGVEPGERRDRRGADRRRRARAAAARARRR